MVGKKLLSNKTKEKEKMEYHEKGGKRDGILALVDKLSSNDFFSYGSNAGDSNLPF